MLSQRFIERVLRDDCDVTPVTSAKDALARLDGGATFDVILCDVMMPEMNGIELYRVLGERHASVVPNVYFMTGGAFTPEAARFLESLPNTHLDKPMTKEALRRVIATQADHPRALPAEQVARVFRDRSIETYVEPKLGAAIDIATSLSTGSEAVVILGSIALAGEARAYVLGLERDPPV